MTKARARSQDCWELSFSNASKEGSWVIVYTNTDEEFMGEIHYNSGSEDPRELTLRNPFKITRKKDGEIIEEKWGKEILFPEKDVRRVVFFSARAARDLETLINLMEIHEESLREIRQVLQLKQQSHLMKYMAAYAENMRE